MKKTLMLVSLIAVCIALAPASSMGISKPEGMGAKVKIKLCPSTPDWLRDVPAFSDIYCCSEADVNARNDCLKNNFNGLNMTDSFINKKAPQPSSPVYGTGRNFIKQECQLAAERAETELNLDPGEELSPDTLSKLYCGKIECTLRLLKLYYDNIH